MAALTEARITPRRDGKTFARKVAGTKKIFGGALVLIQTII